MTITQINATRQQIDLKSYSDKRFLHWVMRRKGFLRLWTRLRRKERMQTPFYYGYVVNFSQSLLSPVSSPMHFFKTKKGEGLFLFKLLFF